LTVATCAAPTNIAALKYWGKASEALNTPINSSVSVTLHQDQLRTKTTVASAPSFRTTRLWLNGKEQPINKRVATVIREMKLVAKRPQHWEHAHLHIVSENSFPTAAGLASSAAGYACLVAALAELFEVDEQFPGHLSTIARQGSGSACRSLYGGFVRWEKGGEHEDGRDSRAVQVADEHYWKELCAIICVVNDKEKDTSSTSGMKTSKDTSALLQFRADHVVDDRLAVMERAYLAKDFVSFGKLTMQDSNQFHATCLDTYPPIFYLNDISRKIIHLVHAYNAQAGKVQAAYTFDAGPNAVIFLEEQHVQEVMSLLLQCFPSSSPVEIKSSIPVDGKASTLVSSMKLPAPTQGGIKMFYVSRVGGGTRVLGPQEALVDLETGEPLLSSSSSRQKERSDCFWARQIHENAWFPYIVGAAAVGAVAVAAMTARR
uniref:Diphosphomevalonate decarboxylase n=1 Tax=Globisporangium ultimum (strain ATCC 200006 / CBS 805.95 / DAOM BR144) TaxID=431595 RepID=K3WFN8_GLOUD